MGDGDWGPRERGRGWESPGGWEMHDGWGLGGWILMALLVLLLVAVLAAVVVLTVRAAGTRPGPAVGAAAGSSAQKAEQVLDERFARGEIEEDEYLRRRSVLRGQPTPTG